MKSKRGWGVLGVVLCSLLIASAAFAQEGRGRGREERGQRQERMAERQGRGGEQEGEMNRPGRPGLRILRELDLTEEQREQIKAIHEKYAPQIEAAHDVVRERHVALREAVKANPVNEGAIRSAAAQLGNATGDIAVLMANQRAEIRAILTAEQQEKYDAAVEELPGIGQQMRQGGGRGGQGGEGRGRRGGPGGDEGPEGL